MDQQMRFNTISSRLYQEATIHSKTASTSSINKLNPRRAASLVTKEASLVKGLFLKQCTTFLRNPLTKIMTRHTQGATSNDQFQLNSEINELK